MDNTDILKRFYSNPYFDCVIGFVKIEVLTSQDKFAPYNCITCGKNFYISSQKENKQQFVDLIKDKLHKITYPSDWPIKEDIFIQISVSASESRNKKIDIDNLAKTILDSIKDKIIIDDNRVKSLFIEKFHFEKFNLPSFTIAIRKLKPNEKVLPQESLWSNQEYVERSTDKSPRLFHVFDMNPNETITSG